MKWLDEFKAFAVRGNVIDLAVAVVIGAAFGKIISSLVDGIIMPLIGLLLGGIDVAGKTFVFGQATIKWGLFLQSIIDFTIIAFCIFVALKLVNSLQKAKPANTPEKSEEIILLTEIRDLLKQNQRKDNNL